MGERLVMKVSDLPKLTLMGAGPCEVDERVLQAMMQPAIGRLHPQFLNLLADIQSSLRAVYGTTNRATLPIGGSGSAGLEACLVNLVEPGDPVLIGVNGAFGERMRDVARQLGADVTTVESPWGQPLDLEALKSAAARQSFKVLGAVHAETSTGVLQALEPLRPIADRAGALLLVDAVASLGGIPIEMDQHGIDAAFSGTQKCLSCPPGLSPVSLSERALKCIRERTTPPNSWYFDFTRMLAQGEIVYHYSAPSSLLFALHQALGNIENEGLRAHFRRQQLHARALTSALETMGLCLLVPERWRLPTVTVVRVPDGVDEAELRLALVSRHSLEISAGIGRLAGRVWRIGLMGAACSAQHVVKCVAALDEELGRQGFRVSGDGQAAALAVLDNNPIG